MFKLHMAGVMKAESFLFSKNDSILIQYNDIVAQSTKEEFSFAKVGTKIYAFIKTKAYNTVMLCDESGFGFHACYAHNVEGYETDSITANVLATSLTDLDVSDDVKFMLVNSLNDAWVSLVKKSRGWNPMMWVKETEFEAYSDSMLAKINSL